MIKTAVVAAALVGFGGADPELPQRALTIATEAERLWAHDWDMDAIVLTGGGGAVLAPHLRRLLQGEVLAVESDKDPRLNNVHGYAKYARHLWARVPRAQAAAS